MVTNLFIERLVSRDCYLVSRDAGEILLISNIVLLRDRPSNNYIQVGSVVVSHVTGFTTTWVSLLTLLALHLSLNYAAVHSVQMTSLNRQRANIVLSALFESDTEIDLTATSITSKTEPKSEHDDTSKHPHTWKVLTPAQVASQERIFHRGGALQWMSLSRGTKTYLGSAEIGISLDSFFKHARRYTHSTCSTTRSRSGSTSFQTPLPLQQLKTLFTNESYILFLFPSSRSKWHASILLKKGCTVTAQLKGWAHALLAARVLSETSSSLKDTHSSQMSQDVFDVVASVLDILHRGEKFGGYVAALKGVGWDVDVGALETRGGRRVSFG